MSEKLDGLQGRDTVYIDTDDDITSIIEKVSESENSVVALVPPKRIGALQSVVNLKLLLKAAKTNRKKIALVTTDKALLSLAAGLRIPVAKSLTAQSELLDIPDMDDSDDDVINGKDVAVGDLARITGDEKIRRNDSREDKEISAAVAAIETDDKIKNDIDADGTPDDKQKTKSKDKRKNVPNFDKFRRILFIGGGLAVLLVAFLVWAIGFAPRATITIATKTRSVAIDGTITLSSNSATNIDENQIQPVLKQIKKSETMEFDATGEKEVGEKAKGKVIIKNCIEPFNDITLKAGTILTDKGSGLKFALDTDISIPKAIVSGNLQIGIKCTKAGESKPVGVTAVNIGEEYNISGTKDLSVDGGYNATPQAAFSGGTKKTIKVVTEADLATVSESLKVKFNDDIKESTKKELESQMGDSVMAIDGSFTDTFGEVGVKPEIGAEVESGKATATLETTYVMMGIPNSDLENWLTIQIENKADINEKNPQKIYDTGLKQAKFDFNNDTKILRIRTNEAKIGVVLDENEIKKNAVGKQSGVIAADLEKISGVENATVEFSPFWVSTAPSVDKITVKFSTDE
ncbi:MAG: hypothetical protein LBM09_01680 [Candidatus Nomurabacteria bacterium]|jgi:hypothetical protein|nr:hypothetical protein [Candidatus Nomurabacteria bacterium]